jgi:hypothetical protein
MVYVVQALKYNVLSFYQVFRVNIQFFLGKELNGTDENRRELTWLGYIQFFLGKELNGPDIGQIAIYRIS